MYYKQGVTDPDYCVLKFTVIKGRHYRDLKTERFKFRVMECVLDEAYIRCYKCRDGAAL